VKKVIAFATLLLVMSMSLVACGGGSPAPTPTQVQRATSTPVALQPTSTQRAPQPTAASKEYDLSQAADLSALNSYRAHYTFQWETTESGQKQTGSWDVLVEFVKQPPAQRIVWQGTGTGQPGPGENKVELIQIGQDAYLNSGSGWVAMKTSEENIFGDNQFLTDPLGLIADNSAQLVQKKVMVNGVSTDHYVFDESTLGTDPSLGIIAKANGDVWVSPQFNVVVKYKAHYEGQELAIAGGGEGKLDVAFDLTDINRPINIQAPQSVKPALPEDIPIMEGATELTAISGAISYKIAKSVDDVTAFYETQMPAKGWSKGQGVIPGMLSFSKGERIAQIMVQSEEGITTVAIIVGP